MRLEKNITTMGQTRIYFQPDPAHQKVITVAWPRDHEDRAMWDQILEYVGGLEEDLNAAEQEAIQVHALREELSRAQAAAVNAEERARVAEVKARNAVDARAAMEAARPWTRKQVSAELARQEEQHKAATMEVARAWRARILELEATVKDLRRERAELMGKAERDQDAALANIQGWKERALDAESLADGRLARLDTQDRQMSIMEQRLAKAEEEVADYRTRATAGGVVSLKSAPKPRPRHLTIQAAHEALADAIVAEGVAMADALTARTPAAADLTPRSGAELVASASIAGPAGLLPVFAWCGDGD